MNTPDRRALVDHGHSKLSVRRQYQLLGITRSGILSAAKGKPDTAKERTEDAEFYHQQYKDERLAEVR